jgi:hypothetical protein
MQTNICKISSHCWAKLQMKTWSLSAKPEANPSSIPSMSIPPSPSAPSSPSRIRHTQILNSSIKILGPPASIQNPAALDVEKAASLSQNRSRTIKHPCLISRIEPSLHEESKDRAAGYLSVDSGQSACISMMAVNLNVMGVKDISSLVKALFAERTQS